MPLSESVRRARTLARQRYRRAVRFFYAEAGLSYDPAKETKEEGRMRCARALAVAEREAASAGFSFAWEHEPEPVDRSGIEHDGPLWSCVCHDADGKVVGSLGCIDLGADGHPDSEPYARVVRAELALEALDA